MAEELRAGKRRRWYGAIIVDRHTNICHEGLMILLAIVRAQRGRRCWVARANDFHFSAARLERTAQGHQLIMRKMDRVKSAPLPLPFTIIADEDLPAHLRRRPDGATPA